MGNDGYSDYERVELFLERVNKLKNNSLVREGKLKRVSSWSKFDEATGYRHELLDIDDKPLDMESFEALVAAFRLIYMEKEPTYIEKIYTIVYDALPSHERLNIQYFWQNWQQALEEDSHLSAEDGNFIKLDKVLKNWLYGELFHSDKDKREFVKKWGKTLEAEAVFIINFLCHYVFWLGSFVEEAMDKKLLTLPR
jgi:hypothetical protein